MTSLGTKNTTLILGNMITGGIISVGIYTYYSSTKISSVTGPVQQKETRKVLFWYDPMYPNIRFDKPGKSPFMGVDLIPKYVDEETANASSSDVRIDPTQTQSLGLETEPVRRGPLHYAQTLPANVSYNEYQFVIVQARSADFTEKVYPLTVGNEIKKGLPLVNLTIPDWVEVQSEYLLLRETGGSTTQVEGILERLCLAGTPEVDIQRSKSTRKIQIHLILETPIGGMITAFGLRTGMNIPKGNMVAKIRGIDPVWVSASAPEPIAWLIKDASQFTITVPAWPDKPFTISKWGILPSVGATTRTLQLRLQVGNLDEALRPGMNTYLQLKIQSEPMPLIPSRTLIDTSTEQRVIAVNNEGRFVPKQVMVFHGSQRLTAIRSGLTEGGKMVSSGLFLIDSEANISGVLNRMRVQNSKAQDITTMPAQAIHSHQGHDRWLSGLSVVRR